MPDITNYTPTPINDLMSQITLYKYNPSAIQRVILDNLYQMTQGAADVVDATNPFTFLLESSCVNTAAAIQESLVNLRKQYASVAQSFDDLYLHMSDLDYVNIFASPSLTDFTLLIHQNDLINNLVYNPSLNVKMVTIPRNTKFTVNNIVFSIQYPINIVQYTNGSIQISYDTTVTSPLQELSTNIIKFTTGTDASGVTYIQFQVPVMQFDLNSTNFPIQASSILNEAIPFTNQFYYCRAYYQNTNTSNKWIEINTTYTEQIFDPFNVTVSLSVDNTNNLLNVFLPPVYVDNGLISGTLRIDIYTTNGDITVNLSNYQYNAFTTNMYAVDAANDLNQYTANWGNISYLAYSTEMVQGGNNGQTFEQLRTNVINNNIGIRNIPITEIQLEGQGIIDGFTITKNVDYITDRIFQASQSLPTPTNAALITPAALSVDTFITNIAQLNAMTQVVNNNTQSTILSKTVFVETNGVLGVYDPNSLSTLLSGASLNIVNTVNSTNFLYNPFYYVLDYSNVEFSLRAYDLDSPSSSQINFIYQNPTLQLVVNTGNIQIAKTSTGYQVTITTASGNFYQQLSDSYVQCQLAFIPAGENNYAYLNATLIGKTASKERIWQFNIDTNYYTDTNDNLNFTNFTMFGTTTLGTLSNLNQNFYIFYTTNSIPTGFTTSTADSLIGKSLLPKNAAAITQEQVTLTFGNALNNLWRRSLVNQSGTVYKTYTADVPALYTSIVYSTNPNTGSIVTVTNTNQISAPQAPTATLSTTGGILPTNTNIYATIVGVDSLGRYTTPSTEVSTNTGTGTTSSIAYTWPVDANVATYQIWIGTATTQENMYFTSNTNSFTLTNLNGTTGTPPTQNTTGTITAGFTVLHNLGDPILDSNGNQLYLHRAGDIMLDSNGNPIIETDYTTQYSCDILLVDGKYYFATDPAYIAYQTELRSVLNTWITQSLENMNDTLLEQTQIYFYPQKSASVISVMLDENTTVSISAKQSFTVNLYVSTTVFNDSNLRAQLNKVTITTINTAIQNTIVGISDIISQLKTVYGDSVMEFNVKGLGGATNNYDTVTLVNANQSLSLNKILTLQQDGTFIVSEDVTINYIDYSNT